MKYKIFAIDEHQNLYAVGRCELCGISYFNHINTLSDNEFLCPKCSVVMWYEDKTLKHVEPSCVKMLNQYCWE